MKALVHRRYGSIDDLELKDVPLPVVGSDQVRVRVRATSMHADIWHVITGRPYALRLMGAGLFKPRPGAIPGTDVAGVVETVGAGVTEFKAGDRVFGEVVSDFQWKHGGSYAEYVSVKAAELALMPDNASFEEAATLPTSAMIALRSLRMAGEQSPGERLLINGAAGNVGAHAVQLGKAYGLHVTAVDTGAKLERLRALGADEVVDYRQTPVLSLPGRYHLILDVASTLPFLGSRKLLTPNGKYVLVGHDHFGKKGRAGLGSLPHAFGIIGASVFFRHLPDPKFNFDQKRLLLDLREFLNDRKLTPDIEQTYPLEQVPVAYRYMLSGNTQGRLVITP